MSRERWDELPDVVRDSFITPTFRKMKGTYVPPINSG